MYKTKTGITLTVIEGFKGKDMPVECCEHDIEFNVAVINRLSFSRAIHKVIAKNAKQAAELVQPKLGVFQTITEVKKAS